MDATEQYFLKQATGFLNRSIAKYRLRLALKRLGARVLGVIAPSVEGDSLPPVTVLIVSYNTMLATELTLRTLRQHTRYPNYDIWVVENGSTDGSLEVLREMQEEFGYTLIESKEAKQHAHWLDYAMQHVETPYWVAVDSDMLFLGQDWLYDIIIRLESDPDLYLVGCEPVPGGVGVEPVGGKIVEAGEHVATWLFGARTSLRDSIPYSFAFYKAGINDATGLERVFDSGGKILAEMRKQGIRYDYMPVSFRTKYYHYGSLSWAFDYNMPERYRELKALQLQDIERLVCALRRTSLT